jgi:signal transduction histidine kinase
VRQFASLKRAGAIRPLRDLLALLDEVVELSIEGHDPEERAALAIGSADALGATDEAEIRLVLCRLALDHHRLRELRPDEALGTVLAVLAALGGVRDASVWAPARPTGIQCLACHGSDPTRRMRSVARAALRDPGDEKPGPGLTGAIVGLPIQRMGEVAGALVVRLAGGDRTLGIEAASLAARAMGPLLERAALLETNAERDQLIVESANRKLARLTLDMHDGPVQDVIALLSDVRLYKSQLTQKLIGVPQAELLIGRVDDFEARLLAIDAELRQFAQSFESPSVLERPLREAIESEIEPTRKAGVEAFVEVRLDDAASLTASQRIALLRIVQEGLSNVRDHSGATSVSVSIVHHGTHTTLQVTDDGAGFNVERTLVRAARSGRLGLVGMAERVRLLGGTFDIVSAPGAGTTISAALPRWIPPSERGG